MLFVHTYRKPMSNKDHAATYLTNRWYKYTLLQKTILTVEMILLELQTQNYFTQFPTSKKFWADESYFASRK